MKHISQNMTYSRRNVAVSRNSLINQKLIVQKKRKEKKERERKKKGSSTIMKTRENALVKVSALLIGNRP